MKCSINKYLGTAVLLLWMLYWTKRYFTFRKYLIGMSENENQTFCSEIQQQEAMSRNWNTVNFT